MRRFKIVTLVLTISGLLGVTQNAAAAPLLVTTDSNANDLLAVLLGSTTGLSGLTATYTGDPLSAGVFSGGPFGLSSGVVLSTGDVNTSEGANTSISAGTDLGAVGPSGDTATLSIQFTSDATVDTLFFTYVFGSEEFYEFIGSQFNDFFTLTLDGTNFARLNCGSTVAINNFTGACASELINNTGGTETQLDAYTIPLLFAAPLSPGTHTLVFSIGDVSDGKYDSAVFVKGGSLGTTNPPTVPEPTSLLLFGLGAAAAALRHRARREPQ